MIRPPNNLKSAFKILKVTAAGGATVFLSTVTSCYLAVVVEKTAHRVQYHFFPHWYKDVDFALGLDLDKGREYHQNSMNMNTNMNMNSSSQNSQNNLEMDGISEKIFNALQQSSSDGIDGEGVEEEKMMSRTTNNELPSERLQAFWHDDQSNNTQFDQLHLQFGEDKFEISSSVFTTTTTTTTTNEGDKEKEKEKEQQPSPVNSLQSLLTSSTSGESMSNALQSCAMTS